MFCNTNHKSYFVNIFVKPGLENIQVVSTPCFASTVDFILQPTLHFLKNALILPTISSFVFFSITLSISILEGVVEVNLLPSPLTCQLRFVG